MSFGALVVLFLFGLLFGVSALTGKGSSTSTGSATTTATSGAGWTGYPRTVNEADSGKSISMGLHEGIALRFSHKWRGSDPQVGGAAVRLTPVNYFRDPGYDEWTIEPVKRGTATITATRGPGAKPFRLTVRVR